MDGLDLCLLNSYQTHLTVDKHVEEAVKEFGELVVERAKKELNAVKPRKVYRASWSNGKLKSVQVKVKNYKSNSTGELRDSIDYKVTNDFGVVSLSIMTAEHGDFVNRGRLPGKGIPPRAMAAWIKAKGIRPQNIKSGGFVKSKEGTAKGDANLKAMAFMMNRKIKFFGIEANPFMTDAIAFAKPLLQEKLGPAYAQDIVNNLEIKYGI